MSDCCALELLLQVTFYLRATTPKVIRNLLQAESPVDDILILTLLKESKNSSSDRSISSRIVNTLLLSMVSSACSKIGKSRALGLSNIYPSTAGNVKHSERGCLHQTKEHMLFGGASVPLICWKTILFASIEVSKRNQILPYLITRQRFSFPQLSPASVLFPIWTN